MVENRIMSCHGNHAFSHSQNKFFLRTKNNLHSAGGGGGGNEQFGTHEKLSWGAR